MSDNKKQSNYKNLCLCGCGQLCKNKWKRGHSNKINNHFYKRGYHVTKKGYIKISIGNKKSKFEHRLVFEHYLKIMFDKDIYIPNWIDIHHIDGNVQNNSLINLQPCTRGQHNKIEKTRNLSHRICLLCNSKKTYKKIWLKYKNGFICNNCFNKRNYRKKKGY